jgi:4a-hydroxytetrahydrobiopterin dehydratase
MDLASMSCTSDRDTAAPLTRKEIAKLKKDVSGWRVNEGRLIRRFEKKDFADCLEFINEVGELSIKEGHFPDICIKENHYVDITWYSYHCGGLILEDFIMAAKLSAREFTKEGMSI